MHRGAGFAALQATVAAGLRLSAFLRGSGGTDLALTSLHKKTAHHCAGIFSRALGRDHGGPAGNLAYFSSQFSPAFFNKHSKQCAFGTRA